MTKAEFFEGVRELRRACDLSDAPRKEVMAVWYRHLSWIDAKQWGFVVERMVRTHDGFPRNLVQAVGTYVEQRRERPLDFGDLRCSAEDDEAARECFEQLARVGLMVGEREEVSA